MNEQLDLRPGAHVRWLLGQSDEWREGVVLRSSPNGEERLVKHRFGRTWVHWSRLAPAGEPTGV